MFNGINKESQLKLTYIIISYSKSAHDFIQNENQKEASTPIFKLLLT